uniref:Neuropeptide-Like Protein n=1 Tax=Parastrongyloides trichosuri TaxID=131310 RepID=A0A0N4ZAG1_PARTI
MYLKTVVSLSIFIFVLGSTLLNASESSIQTQLPIASTDDNLIDMNEYSKYLSARVEKKGGGRGFYKPRLIEDRSGGRRFYNLQHPFKRSSDEDISGANDLIYYDQQEKRGGGRSFLPPYNTLMYPNEW